MIRDNKEMVKMMMMRVTEILDLKGGPFRYMVDAWGASQEDLCRLVSYEFWRDKFNRHIAKGDELYDFFKIYESDVLVLDSIYDIKPESAEEIESIYQNFESFLALVGIAQMNEELDTYLPYLTKELGFSYPKEVLKSMFSDYYEDFAR